MLEALHPGRIDLGIGRAPGTDQITASALRRSAGPLSERTSRGSSPELIGFFKGEFSTRDPYRHVNAVPGNGDMPEIWLLGSSGLLGPARRAAGAAVLLRPPLHAAEHRRGARALPLALRALGAPGRAVRDGRRARRSAAEDDERARYLSGPARLSMARLRAGHPTRFPTPEEAAAHEFSAGEEDSINALSGSAAIGGPDTVRAKLDALRERTAADELMITTMVHDHADRIRSYELIAETYDLPRADAVGAAAMEDR